MALGQCGSLDSFPAAAFGLQRYAEASGFRIGICNRYLEFVSCIRTGREIRSPSAVGQYAITHACSHAGPNGHFVGFTFSVDKRAIFFICRPRPCPVRQRPTGRDNQFIAFVRDLNHNRGVQWLRAVQPVRRVIRSDDVEPYSHLGVREMAKVERAGDWPGQIDRAEVEGVTRPCSEWAGVVKLPISGIYKTSAAKGEECRACK